MSGEKKSSFWEFASENPVMLIIVLIIVLGIIAIVMGYREGFASVLTGLFGFMKRDDADRKIQEKELDARKVEADNRRFERDVVADRKTHDEEVEENAASAKAECDEMDIDELVDIGNAMLRGASTGYGGDTPS